MQCVGVRCPGESVDTTPKVETMFRIEEPVTRVYDGRASVLATFNTGKLAQIRVAHFAYR